VITDIPSINDILLYIVSIPGHITLVMNELGFEHVLDHNRHQDDKAIAVDLPFLV
jgi:hypothetical protein